MKRLLHTYLRRLIRWAGTPSDEDREIASRENWLHRLSYATADRPKREFYNGRSLQSLAEIRDAFGELERRAPGTNGRLNEHLAFIDYMLCHDGRLPPPEPRREAAA